MTDKAHIMEVADRLLQNTDKYLVDVRVKTGNIITVIIDGDSSVTIDDCSRLSKGIEAELNREEEDFELRVTSFGADKPLKLKRQYRKNIGRKFEVIKTDESRESGKLIEVTGDSIVLEPEKMRGKNEQPQPVTIKFDDIKEAKIILSFK
ncbi:MAG: ribosome assembly cofactor RimP [Bacteroidales bacterium]